MGQAILCRVDQTVYEPLATPEADQLRRHEAEDGSRRLLEALLAYNDRLQREKRR